MPILHFKGKSVIQNHHHTVKFHELTPVRSKGTSKVPSLDDNLIIHGDNLIALKALLPTYAGKVKCIYIDPPYNTGNEHWKYNDNVSSPMIKEWIGKEVARDDLSRHDKWCCMMYPRLALLKELLAEDGVIFISIDDGEQQHLRMIMDEVFGESNFIANVVWQKKQSPQNDATYLSDMHDFILVYAKKAKENKADRLGWDRQLVVRGEEQESRYTNPDNDKRGTWTSVDCTCNKTASERPNLYYAIQNPKTGEKIFPSKQRVWRYEQETMNKLLAEKQIWWGDSGDNFPRLKRFRTEVRDGVVPSTWWEREFAGDNQFAKREIREIFAELENAFDTPKPTQLLRRILEIAVKNDESAIVLDSFAGSGTTAHAVLALNAEDGGNRRFVLVETEDYADKLTAERVRRVSKGVKGARDEKLQKGLGGTFSYYELGKPIDIDKMLEGDNLPSYESLANYAFFTATGETFKPKSVSEKDFYVGSSSSYEVFMLYTPDASKLRELALNLDFAQKIEKKFPSKPKLVFAPACYLEEFDLRERNIRFAQLPFEIYRLAD